VALVSRNAERRLSGGKFQAPPRSKRTLQSPRSRPNHPSARHRSYALEPFVRVPVCLWDRWRTIAMRYLAAIAIAAFVTAAGLAVYSVDSLPSVKQSAPTTTQLAVRLAESVDPFLPRSGS
jgi:hypothetical protein